MECDPGLHYVAGDTSSCSGVDAACAAGGWCPGACRCLLVIDVPELEQTRLNWIDHLRRNGVVPDGMDGFSLLQFSPALRAGVLNFGQMHGCVFESAACRMSLHAASADPGPLLLYPSPRAA